MLSLTDLRARQVVPDWQEAVAVVQELIHTVAQTQGRDVPLPDIDHIALIANGEVVALPGSPPTGNPVRHAAQLLEQMLEGGTAPPELVTLVNDNATDSPKLPNLAELTRQLAFFERPGRRSDVEGLVSRAMSADAQNRAEEELRRLKERTLVGDDLDAFQTESEIQEQKKAEEPRAGRRQATVALALLLVAAVAGGGWWLYGWYRDGGLASLTAAAPEAPVMEAGDPPADALPADPDDAQPAAPTSAEAVPDAEAAKSPSLFERARVSIQRAVESTFGPSPAADEEEPAAADAAGEAAPGQTGVSRSRARRSASAASKSASGSTPGSAPTAAASEPPQVSTTVAKPPMTSEPTSVSSVSEARSVVYSRNDADVRPAVLLRPLLPAEPPPDVPPDQIGTLELIVDEFGDVEQVRLISPANRFHERMLVAHAKSWKFRPAIRDGQPVKYLTIVRLTI